MSLVNAHGEDFSVHLMLCEEEEEADSVPSSSHLFPSTHHQTKGVEEGGWRKNGQRTPTDIKQALKAPVMRTI